VVIIGKPTIEDLESSKALNTGQLLLHASSLHNHG